jgi:hypothetical protein
VIALACSRCGAPAPADADGLAAWEYGSHVARGDVDDVTASMLVCPDCRDELHDEAYEGEAQA